jgi:hypothetical protein
LFYYAIALFFYSTENHDADPETTGYYYTGTGTMPVVVAGVDNNQYYMYSEG